MASIITTPIQKALQAKYNLCDYLWSRASVPGVIGTENEHTIAIATEVANVSECLCDHMQCTGSYIDLTETCVLNCFCECHSKYNPSFNMSKEEK
jgi:hypothetical protein